MIRGDAHDLFFDRCVISEGITDDCCGSNWTHADIWHIPNWDVTRMLESIYYQYFQAFLFFLLHFYCTFFRGSVSSSMESFFFALGVN